LTQLLHPMYSLIEQKINVEVYFCDIAQYPLSPAFNSFQASSSGTIIPLLNGPRWSNQDMITTINGFHVSDDARRERKCWFDAGRQARKKKETIPKPRNFRSFGFWTGSGFRWRFAARIPGQLRQNQRWHTNRPSARGNIRSYARRWRRALALCCHRGQGSGSRNGDQAGVRAPWRRAAGLRCPGRGLRLPQQGRSETDVVLQVDDGGATRRRTRVERSGDGHGWEVFLAGRGGGADRSTNRRDRFRHGDRSLLKQKRKSSVMNRVQWASASGGLTIVAIAASPHATLFFILLHHFDLFNI